MHRTNKYEFMISFALVKVVCIIPVMGLLFHIQMLSHMIKIRETIAIQQICHDKTKHCQGSLILSSLE